MKVLSLISLAASIALVQTTFAQKIDLAKMMQDHRITVFNRQGSVNGDIFRLDAQTDASVAWLDGINFSDGTIEFDVKGKDVFQQSFVGIAFHGIDDKTYESVYFRPFNFRTDDAARKQHAVQYISLPNYDWPKLREQFPNKYEQPVIPIPDPDQWFHVRIVISDSVVKVYVNANAEPSLTITELEHPAGKKIGLWVGNGSDGEWRNLVIH